MSDLLEQAIIDATALKEAAIKNAENALIEKYSYEFKNTVQKLLEQEELAATAGAPQQQMPPPVAPDAQAAAGADPNAAPQDPSMQTPVDPMAAGGQPAAGQDIDDPLAKIPAAFADADEDEIIRIDFKGIKSALNEMLGINEEELEEMDRERGSNDPTHLAPKSGRQNVAEYELEEEQLEEMELEEESVGAQGGAAQPVDEELELEELTLEEDVLEEMDDVLGVQSAQENAVNPQSSGEDEEAKKIAAAKLNAELADAQAKEVAAEQALKAAQQQLDAKKLAMQQIAEDVEISDEELLSLAEELRVDINIEGQGRGYMGSTTTEKRLQREAELAAARDDVNVKAREEELKKMQDLVNENLELKSLNDEMMTLLEGLKGQIEKMNLSNAKLLYTNKALVNISLNERQKNHIVESISKAGSVLEAKTVYDTLQSTVESVRKEEKAPKSLSEALNRAQSPFVVRKSPASSITDMQSERMKLLAGIKLTK